jgi:phage gp29-like protein
LHVYGGKSGHPTRSALHRITAWWWMFKNYAVKDWLIFAEVYGMPLRLGKYPAGASKEDKDALIEAISSLGTDAAGIISDATQIEFIETAKGKSSGDLYKYLAEFGNKEISIAWVGQTLTADVGSVGSKAAAQVHNDVRMDLIRADARAIAATVRHQLFRPIVGFNFGWDAPCPKYTAYFSGEDDDIRKARAEWIGDLLDRNVAMPAAWLRKQFAIPEPEKGEEIIGLPKAADDAVAAKRVAAADKPGDEADDPADWAARKVAADAHAAVSDIISTVYGLLESEEDLEAVSAKLYDLFPDLPRDELADILGEAMAAANLAGRYEVDE